MSPGDVCPAFLRAILSWSAIPGKELRSGSLKFGPSEPRYPNVEVVSILLLIKYSSTIVFMLSVVTLLKNNLDCPCFLMSINGSA